MVHRAALLLVVKISKLVFVTVGYGFVGVLTGGSSSSSSVNGDDGNGGGVQLSVLQQALPHIPSLVGDCMIRSVALTLSKTLLHNITATSAVWTHFVSRWPFTKKKRVQLFSIAPAVLFHLLLLFIFVAIISQVVTHRLVMQRSPSSNSSPSMETKNSTCIRMRGYTRTIAVTVFRVPS